MKEVVQRTGVVSHEARRAGKRELLGVYIRIHYTQGREGRGDERKESDSRIASRMQILSRGPSFAAVIRCQFRRASVKLVLRTVSR